MDENRGKARLYVIADLAADGTVDLQADQAHYLNRVMRLGVGDAVDLFNGRDGEWRATIETAARNHCTLRCADRRRDQRASPDLWLAFAPIKKQRLDFLIEKATELGAARLQPVFTRHTAVTRVNLDRLRAQAIEAAEQCERLDVPAVDDAVDLDALLAAWPVDRPMIVLDERGDAPPAAEALQGLGRPGRGGILVGPEGGFASSELDALRKLPFALPVGLGPRILRADTAAIAALACWQALVGDWRDRPPA